MTNLITPTLHLSTPTFEEVFRVVISTSNNKRCCVSVTLQSARLLFLRQLKYNTSFKYDQDMLLCLAVDVYQVHQSKSYLLISYFTDFSINPFKILYPSCCKSTDPQTFSDKQPFKHANLHQGLKRWRATFCSSILVQAVSCQQPYPICSTCPISCQLNKCKNVVCVKLAPEMWFVLFFFSPKCYFQHFQFHTLNLQ